MPCLEADTWGFGCLGVWRLILGGSLSAVHCRHRVDEREAEGERQRVRQQGRLVCPRRGVEIKTSQAHAGGREEGGGRRARTHPEIRARYISRHPHACIFVQRLNHALTCQRCCLPPPPHTTAVLGPCCMQCGTCSATAGVRAQACAHIHRASTRGDTTPAHSHVHFWNQNTTAGKFGTRIRSQGLGGDTSGDPTPARRCTVRQAATTGGTRGNCSVQPTLPYAPATYFSHEFGRLRNSPITCTKWPNGSDKVTKHVCLPASRQTGWTVLVWQRSERGHHAH